MSQLPLNLKRECTRNPGPVFPVGIGSPKIVVSTPLHDARHFLLNFFDELRRRIPPAE